MSGATLVTQHGKCHWCTRRFQLGMTAFVDEWSVRVINERIGAVDTEVFEVLLCENCHNAPGPFPGPAHGPLGRRGEGPDRMSGATLVTQHGKCHWCTRRFQLGMTAFVDEWSVRVINERIGAVDTEVFEVLLCENCHNAFKPVASGD